VKARGQAGFTYLGLIIFVAIIGLVGAATLKIGSLLQRAAAEEELLDIGAAFSAALDSYAAATPRGASPYPPSLAELLKDPRSPAVRRHLRKIYVDPLTGKAEWGIVYLGGGETGVVAIHSLSSARPLKVANFDSRFKGLDNKATISEWRFSAGERSLAPAVTSTQSGGPGAQPAPPVEQPAPTPAPTPVPTPVPPPAPAVEEPAPPEPAGEESEAVDRE
jgi:type II secretory pathway pseudopilin PulG